MFWGNICGGSDTRYLVLRNVCIWIVCIFACLFVCLFVCVCVCVCVCRYNDWNRKNMSSNLLKISWLWFLSHVELWSSGWKRQPIVWFSRQLCTVKPLTPSSIVFSWIITSSVAMPSSFSGSSPLWALVPSCFLQHKFAFHFDQKLLELWWSVFV